MKLVDSKIVMRLAVAALAVAITLGTLGVAASRTAHAAANDTVVHHVINGSWYLHPGNPTDTPSFSGPISDLMTQGTEFDVVCATAGPPITPDGNLATDGNGDVAWEYGTDATTGDMGFVSDQGLDTQVTPGGEVAQLEAQGIPGCGSNGTAQQDSNSATIPVNPEYNRTAAVEYALANAQDPQTNGEECTKFVSQALWAGGLPQDAEWNNNGWYLSGLPFPTIFDGTKTANAAPLLIPYLENYYSTQWIQLNVGTNDVPQAEPGDIIVYSWNGENPDGSLVNMDHLAFVVDSDPNDSAYPLVAEWGQFENYGPADYINNPTSPYVDRDWNWSAMNNEALQQEHPNVAAYLLHFNGGIFVANY